MIETIIKIRDGRPDPRNISTIYVEAGITDHVWTIAEVLAAE
jgi:hypothetical protein